MQIASLFKALTLETLKELKLLLKGSWLDEEVFYNAALVNALDEWRSNVSQVQMWYRIDATGKMTKYKK